MVGEFTFNGIDIAALGLHYVPELEDTFVYKPAKTNIYDETFDGHNGGYFYGSAREPKEFILRCYYEHKHINRGIMSRVYQTFKIGTSGKLIFQKRPWCYYYATVIDIDSTESFNYENGLIKITMKAYYPFARSEMLYIDPNDEDYKVIERNSAFLPAVVENPSQIVVCPIENECQVILLNQGTERAQIRLEIAGDVGTGVTIRNETNGTECKYVAMGAQKFNGNSYVYTDGISGKTISVIEGKKALAFLYHDHGFIELDPAYPCKRDVQIVGDEEGIYTEDLYDKFLGEASADQYIGHYIYIDNMWREITEATTDITGTPLTTLIVDPPVDTTVEETTYIVKMNKISIIPETTMNLKRLNFISQPTFA